MEYSIIQIALVFVVTFIAAIDQFDFLESLYQPIVTGAVIGLILGDLNTGLLVGGTYQLMTIGSMPIGGAQPPNAVIGGIMAAKRTGELVDAKTGKKLNELNPNLYPAKVSASTVTREQVLAELVEAQRNGDIVDVKSAKKLNELLPDSYPKKS